MIGFSHQIYGLLVSVFLIGSINYKNLDILRSLLHRRPKTKRGKRAVERRAPKDVENNKTTLFLRGGKTSELVTNTMKDLVSALIYHISENTMLLVRPSCCPEIVCA